MKWGGRELILFGGVALLFLGYAGVTHAEDSIDMDSPSFYKWDKLLRKYCDQYGVPWRWAKAIMWNESSFGDARSVANGLREPSDTEASVSFDGLSWGLMQTTLETARRYRPNIQAMDLNKPEISIEVGVRELARLYAWARNLKNRTLEVREYVVRAYNGGQGFLNTVQGRTMTPVYYRRFVDHLDKIKKLQPGDDLET